MSAVQLDAMCRRVFDFVRPLYNANRLGANFNAAETVSQLVW